MTTAILSYLRVPKKLKNKAAVSFFPDINWKFLCFTALFACLFLLVYYVWQVRYLTSGSYLINNYEREINGLMNEKKDLEILFAESSFLEEARQKIRELNFQRTTSLKYIQIPDNYLARAK